MYERSGDRRSSEKAELTLESDLLEQVRDDVIKGRAAARAHHRV